MLTPEPTDALVPLREAAAVAGISTEAAYARIRTGLWPAIKHAPPAGWMVPRLWLPSIPKVEAQIRQARHLGDVKDRVAQAREEMLRAIPGPDLLTDARELLAQFERVLTGAEGEDWFEVREQLHTIRLRLLTLTDVAQRAAIARAVKAVKAAKAANARKREDHDTTATPDPAPVAAADPCAA